MTSKIHSFKILQTLCIWFLSYLHKLKPFDEENDMRWRKTVWWLTSNGLSLCKQDRNHIQKVWRVFENMNFWSPKSNILFTHSENTYKISKNLLKRVKKFLGGWKTFGFQNIFSHFFPGEKIICVAQEFVEKSSFKKKRAKTVFAR